MSGLPVALHNALTQALGSEPLRAFPLSGGMVNEAARVETASGSIFVKWKADAPPGLFAAEADGLERLRAAGALRVPRVLAFQDRTSPLQKMDFAGPVEKAGQDTPGNHLPFLALEYIEERKPTDPRRFAQRFGEGLAALHREAVSPFDAFGLENDNYIGTMPQPNTPCVPWPDFYRRRRLLPQIEIVRQRRLLPPEREHRVLQVVERLEELLEGLDSRPALLHGDLWSGNFLPAGEEPVLIDPAVYYGEREVEMAFVELFGGFPAGFLPAYHAAYPLDAGYERRRPLHQLYPLLVHLNHFGERYGPDVDRVCRLYLR